MAQLNVLLSQASPATDRSVPMDDEETEELPRDLMLELGPLSEVREVAHWINDPVPLAHSFLVC